MTYKIKHWFLLLLSGIMTANMYAYDIAAENAEGITLYYDVINDGKELEVVKGRQTYNITGALTIPEEVTFMNRTRKVTSIGLGAFSNCHLTTVDLPGSLTSIRYIAFTFCEMLESIKIPDSVTAIGEYNQEIKGKTNVEIISVIA